MHALQASKAAYAVQQRAWDEDEDDEALLGSEAEEDDANPLGRPCAVCTCGPAASAQACASCSLC